MYFSYLCIFVAFFLFACTSEKLGISGSHGGSNTGATTATDRSTVESYEAAILPADATRKSTLYLSLKSGSLADAKIEWFVNGRPFNLLDAQKFNAADAAKGDNIQAKVTLKGREILSNTVQIKNYPPEITAVKVLPENFQSGDTLSVEAEASDLDTDPVTFVYEWSKNGAVIGTEKSIVVDFKRGDKLSLKVTPFDGESYGVPAVIDREIKNMPPVIVEHNDYAFDGSVYTYQVKATDPDGDALKFSLETSVSGMTIDATTGLLKWVVPQGFTGVQQASVRVEDGHGGIAKYSFKIAIKQP